MSKAWFEERPVRLHGHDDEVQRELTCMELRKELRWSLRARSELIGRGPLAPELKALVEHYDAMIDYIRATLGGYGYL